MAFYTVLVVLLRSALTSGSEEAFSDRTPLRSSPEVVPLRLEPSKDSEGVLEYQKPALVCAAADVVVVVLIGTGARA